MPDINFLTGKKDKAVKKRGRNEKRKIEWTKPVDDEPNRNQPSKGMPLHTDTSGNKRGGPKRSGLFSFFKKSQDRLAGKLTDGELLQRSRWEALELINKREAESGVSDKRGTSPRKKKMTLNGRTSGAGTIKRKDDLTGDSLVAKGRLKTKETKPSLKKTNKSDRHDYGLFRRLINFWRARLQGNTQTPTGPTSGELKRERTKVAGAGLLTSGGVKSNSKAQTDAIQATDGRSSVAFGKILPSAETAAAKKELKTKRKKNAPAPTSAAEIQEKEKGGKWQKARILETNLIRGELASFFDWRKGILTLIFYMVLSSLAVAAMYGGLLLWEKRETAERVDGRLNKMRELNEKVVKPLEEEAREILAVRKNIKLARDLLDNHIYWTNFFKFLEDNTLSEVYYTSAFTGDLGGQYSFLSRTKDFKMILAQVNVMRMNDYVKRVTVSSGLVRSSTALAGKGKSGEGEMGGVDFALELLIDPGIFLK